MTEWTILINAPDCKRRLNAETGAACTLSQQLGPYGRFRSRIRSPREEHNSRWIQENVGRLHCSRQNGGGVAGESCVSVVLSQVVVLLVCG